MAYSKNWHENHLKWMTLDQLTKSLALCPSGSIVCVNGVGNLKVMNADEQYIGYIDFGDTEPNYTPTILEVK